MPEKTLSRQPQLCPQAKRVALNERVACHDPEGYPTKSPRDKIFEGILPGSWEFTHALDPYILIHFSNE
jgi:hypothetical protein